MLRKLFKYEFKAVARFFTPMLGLYLILTVAIRVFAEMNLFETDLPVFFTIIMVLLTTAFSILSFVTTGYISIYCLSRFHKNLFTDEGYLMNTLPVEPHLHVITKFLSMVVWTIIGYIVNFIGLLVVSNASADFNSMWNDMVAGVKYTFEAIADYPLTSILIILLVIFAIICCSLLIYFAIVVGNQANKLKPLIGISVVVVFIILSIICTSTLSEMFARYIDGMSDPQTVINYALLLALVPTIIATVGLYFGTVKLMKTRLNLQ